MIKKDFMKEIENSLKIVKREVDKNIINGDISKAKGVSRVRYNDNRHDFI